MVLSDSQLSEWASTHVDDWEAQNINPASLDLRLGNMISIPRWYWKNRLTRFIAWRVLGQPDARDPYPYFLCPQRRFAKYTLWPDDFVICHSLEATEIPDDLAAVLFSKSTTGRIGLEHMHAGWGDPGFGKDKRAQWTWELKNLAPWPIIIRPGQRIMQLVLLRMEVKPIKLYQGRYQGQRGAQGARIEPVYKGGKIA
jgi:dCTP deaminase